MDAISVFVGGDTVLEIRLETDGAERPAGR